ncbi:MAG: hypothetical protein F6K30_03130 [Cyanothece sp. SIO2G6]|nr:hypothetical protein [Cyanothece sp. SIO2G6]
MSIQENNLISKQNIYRQVTENRPLLLRHMPSSLKETLILALNQRYEELYEEDATGDVLLENTLEKILNSFQENHQLLGQLRYVWMALTLATVVEPTVKYYQPDSQIPEKTIGHLQGWLLKTLMKMVNLGKSSHSTFENIDNSITSANFQHLLSVQKISSFQILSEALDVYVHAIQVLEPHHSLQSLLNILDDCLEGYAIFPGSYGRRELFNWWLLDIVPSCWYLLPPTSVDLPNNLKDSDKGLALSRLEEISSVIWSLIIRASIQAPEKNSSDPQSRFQDNMLPTFSGDVRVRIKNKYSPTTFK